jgi:hypothetical protein
VGVLLALSYRLQPGFSSFLCQEQINYEDWYVDRHLQVALYVGVPVVEGPVLIGHTLGQKAIEYLAEAEPHGG